MTEFNENMIYVPIAVWAGPDHAHEGGGGGYATQDEAIAMGATNIRVSTYNGVPTPWNGMVADWPQHYFTAESPECKCAACQSRGRWEA